MELSLELKNAIECRAEGHKIKDLMKISQAITKRYSEESGTGGSLIRTAEEALVYSIVRMPATFAAVSRALKYTLECVDFIPESILDVGAGTGAASWACNNICSVKRAVCIEREDVMADFGRLLMSKSETVLADAEWIKADFSSQAIPYKADLVIASYALNELSEENRIKTVEKLWNSAERLLIIVEPGTPEGFRQLKKTRNFLIKKGAVIAAPCPHAGLCRLKDEDWCHFTVRVSRSRLHKLIKGGEAPYEDEKFAFMAFSKTKCTNEGMRILRHPVSEKGCVSLEVCTSEENKTMKVFKREKELFKKARKAECGDLIRIGLSK